MNIISYKLLVQVSSWRPLRYLNDLLFGDWMEQKIILKYAWHVNNLSKSPCPHSSLAINNSVNQSLQLTHIQISLHLQIENK
jgi:hypothetical protein